MATEDQELGTCDVVHGNVVERLACVLQVPFSIRLRYPRKPIFYTNQKS
jgi:hypothetical protein